jgi:putative thiamine transport system permease protein
LWLLYLPLLVPQIAFLPGLQMFLLGTGLASGLWPVLLAHLVFVLPYVFLALSDPFRHWDPRLGTIGAALGHGPGVVLWRLRLPMLLRPLLAAAAIGFAVSVGQYLPTLLPGGGRISTLTTEALALASGGDRKTIAVWALGQTGLALVPFVLAASLPIWIWRNRRGMA